jgi:hypothetical protein
LTADLADGADGTDGADGFQDFSSSNLAGDEVKREASWSACSPLPLWPGARGRWEVLGRITVLRSGESGSLKMWSRSDNGTQFFEAPMLSAHLPTSTFFAPPDLSHMRRIARERKFFEKSLATSL